MFPALVLDKTDGFRAEVREIDDDFLSPGDVTIAVAHSTLNFKDALALTDRAPVVRQWPMVAGIDGAGSVLESRHPGWRAGDKVVINGWGVGETHTGCLAARARLSGDWLVPLPEAFSTRQAMAIGTAGYTAMLCVLALERHGLEPGDGDVLVTGATGGVGSVAIALLAALGHRVVAATGKAAESAYLERLGAQGVIDRAELAAPGKPLQRERWAAVVDTLGSHTLANACAQTRYGGAVAACGLAQGADLPGTVHPFILRGVTLYGINSVFTPNEQRREAWAMLARHVGRDKLARMTNEIGLSEVIAHAPSLLEGKVRGRTVVDVNR